MRLSRIFALTLLFSLSGVVRADEGEALAITTVGGKSYDRCQVVRVYPDGVAFRHSRGMAKVLFTDLTPEWRQHFGYDAAKVEAYEHKVQEDRAKAREASVARAVEIQKAWAEAYVRALEIEALAAAQNPSQGMGYGGYGFLNVGLGNEGSWDWNGNDRFNNGFDGNMGRGLHNRCTTSVARGNFGGGVPLTLTSSRSTNFSRPQVSHMGGRGAGGFR